MHTTMATANQSVFLAFAKKSYFIFILGISVLLSGCRLQKNNAPSTSCIVHSLEDSVGASRYVCGNDTNTYLYQNYGLYRCDGTSLTLLSELEHPVTTMACNNDVLYFVLGTKELYKLDFSTEEITCMDTSHRIGAMAAHGDDIFVPIDMQTDSEYGNDSFSLYCYTKDEDGILLNSLFDTPESDSYITISYKNYTLGGSKNTVSAPSVKIQTVQSEDGWAFSYDAPSVDGYNTVTLNIENSLFLLEDSSFQYDGSEYPLSKPQTSSSGGAIIAEHCVQANDKIYALCQYGTKSQSGSPNPTADSKSCDILFCIDPYDGTFSILYQTEQPDEQIAGFSAKNNCIYLLCNDGLYQCSLDGTQRTKLLENEVSCMTFESFHEKLYVFDESSMYAPTLLDVLE